MIQWEKSYEKTAFTHICRHINATDVYSRRCPRIRRYFL